MEVFDLRKLQILLDTHSQERRQLHVGRHEFGSRRDVGVRFDAGVGYESMYQGASTGDSGGAEYVVWGVSTDS